MQLDYIVRKGARKIPDKIALVDVNQQINYGEYDQRCNNFANYVIKDFKINPGDRIALLLEKIF